MISAHGFIMFLTGFTTKLTPENPLKNSGWGEKGSTFDVSN